LSVRIEGTRRGDRRTPTLGDARRGALTLTLALASCAAGDIQIRTTREPALAEAGPSVSIVGVYRDGRLSASYWGDLGPFIARALGSDRCEAAWGDRLRREAPDLYARIDEGSRSHGITDDLIEALAPRAEGGLILTLRSSGHLPYKRDVTGLIRRTPDDEARRKREQEDRAAPAPSDKPEELADQSALELSASLYSVRARATVARIEMRYTGSRLEDAMQAFRRDLQALVPDAHCVGWR
jgi:hypothetical protein